MNECGCVSRKLHLQKLAMGQIGPMGHNLQTPTMSLLVPQLKDLPLSFPSKNLLEITSSPSERREKTVFSVNEALRVSPQILGKMLMWAVLRLSETLALNLLQCWPYPPQDARPQWTHWDRGQSIKRLAQRNEVTQRPQISSSKLRLLCPRSELRPWTAGESPSPSWAFTPRG